MIFWFVLLGVVKPSPTSVFLLCGQADADYPVHGIAVKGENKWLTLIQNAGQA
jgi:hypothetical protein